MPESQKELFNDLGRKIEVAGDILFYKLDDIFNRLEEQNDSSRSSDFLSGTIGQELGKLVTETSSIDDRLVLLNSTASSMADKIRSDLTAIASSSQVGLEEVKTAIAIRDEDLEAKAAEFNTIAAASVPREAYEKPEPRTARETQGPTIEARTNSSLSDDLVNQFIPVLNSASDFLKNWSSPVSVGAALAVPVVGALGVLSIGLYFTIGKLTDAIVEVSHDIRDVAKGGIVGLLTGASVGSSPAQSSEANLAPLATAVIDVRDSISSAESTISEKLTGISAYAESINGTLAGISVEKISSSLDALTESFDNIEFPEYVSDSRMEEIVLGGTRIDYSYQEKMLEILSSPVEVKLVEANTQTERRNEEVDVFSRAVRPLVDGQISLQNMLDSSLRKLNEAVASLSEAPRATDSDRVTRVTDTLNTEMSDDSVQMILGEARMISSAVETIKSELIEFRSEWTSRASSRTTGIGSMPTTKSMN